MIGSLYCGDLCRQLNRRRELLGVIYGRPATMGSSAVGTPARRHPPLTARAVAIARRDRQFRADAHAAGLCVGCHMGEEFNSSVAEGA